MPCSRNILLLPDCWCSVSVVKKKVGTEDVSSVGALSWTAVTIIAFLTFLFMRKLSVGCSNQK